MNKEKFVCELCKKEVDAKHIAWKGSFILCDKCNGYLKRKGKE